MLEYVDVFEETSAPRFGQAAESLGAVLVVTLPDLQQTLFLQHLEMPAEVAVSQGAQVLEVGEDQSLGMRDEGSQDAQPGLLVEDPLETFIREPAARWVSGGMGAPGVSGLFVAILRSRVP